MLYAAQFSIVITNFVEYEGNMYFYGHAKPSQHINTYEGKMARKLMSKIPGFLQNKIFSTRNF